MCSSELSLLDIRTGESVEIANLTITGSNIAFASSQLRDNRHYNVTVRASNNVGSATSYTIISKY